MSRPILIVLFCLALLPAGWLAWLGRDLPHLGSFHDDGVYLEAARGLAAGDGYRIGSLPLRPAQTKYPPGYPLYLFYFCQSKKGCRCYPGYKTKNYL